ncbi:thiamine phosphate synthase [Nocardioides albus]|uniref:Thiamine-phosphate pyrophosphorylase n=1 Tax=Nocardioides albus TaxID=1841 RepID=A0A7W5FB47_9ACTN|nr:thiamine phosphate synthase [Nocardioides albus]MBB3091974.1 thiamine-phosphate pyrophosphorylase [Nocardioides albus]GGU44057.1 thiamine phosphate synthase [Nocardioides albus]
MTHAEDLPRLLVLTDRSQLRLGRGLLATLTECAEAGLTHVVLRELDEPVEQRARLAQAAADLGLVVIAAHAPLPGAAGVQLPSDGGNTSFVGLSGRYNGREDGVTACYTRGRSCHTRAQVAQAAGDGFDYAMLSPYALTESKPGYGPPLGPAAFGDLPLPTYALGGITPDNAAEAVAAGAHGVAVMGAVMRAEDPAEVVRGLLAALATATRPEVTA